MLLEAGANKVSVIKAVREGLAANRIEWLAGIINGTSNFILTEMRDKGSAFADVLAEAQRLGYAEADPTFDIEGVDAAHKATIMSAIAFGIPVQFDKAYVEGITKLSAQDIRYAEQLGYRIKLLGITKRREKGIELRVHPTLIPTKRLIANVEGVMNAVLVKGDAVGATLYYGAGAGAEPGAAAVPQFTAVFGWTLTGPAGSTAATVSSSEVQVIPTAAASAALAAEVPDPRSRGSSDTASPTVLRFLTSSSGMRTPNFSITCSGPISRFFMVSSMLTRSPTSCIRSLSDEMIRTSPPMSRTLQA